MTDAAASTLLAIKTLQAALAVISTVGPTQFRYPDACTLTNASYYDYIIVGGGSAGSVLAYRLSENSSNSVLLIEEGAYPPLESEMAAMFTPLPLSSYDYAVDSADDSYSTQNLQNSTVSLTIGKMLGGSSNLNHMMYVQGDPHDYNQWASILDDNSWNYTEILPYFKKVENLTDSGLLATSFVDVHGTDGMLKIKRQIDDINAVYLDAFAELGITIVDDVSSKTSSLGACNPLFAIDDNLRQSSSIGYLARTKSRSNLDIALSTKATKILIESSTAVGVQVTTSSSETLVLYANKEVVLSAGAIYSPQLLMLSGVGPKSQLEDLGISVVADLPVGQNLMDHPAAVVVLQMEKNSTTTPATDPYKFPVPMVTTYVSLNSSQSYPTYQSINLIFPHDSSAMLQLCSNCFKYNNTICNYFEEAIAGRTQLFGIVNLMMPKSRGNVTITSTDATVDPTVYTGILSNSEDLVLLGKALADYMQVINTTYFVDSNATFVDIDLCTDYTGTEYWECYALAMSSTMWHYSGTCAMGSVVDSALKVKGIANLRVADASVMPTLVSGNINAAVTMIGERAAALILDDS